MMSLATVLLLALCVVYTGACSCIRQNIPEDYCNNDIIIRGKALSRTEEGDYYVYSVQVQTAIKIPDQLRGVNTIVVKTSTSSATCGTLLPLNTSLLLLASVHIDGVISTGLCSGNRKWKDLGAELQKLLTNDFVSNVCAKKINRGA